MSTATAQPRTAPTVIVLKPYKRKVASTRLNWKRLKLERAEYDPDNSRIGRESVGLQSTHNTDNQGDYQQVKAATLRRLIAGGVADYLNAASGILKIQAKVVSMAREEVAPAPSKPIGCERKPATLTNSYHGRLDEQFACLYVRNPVPQKYQPSKSTAQSRKDKESWQAKQGQRPVVLLPRI